MEGVVMRSPNFWGRAVRTPAGQVDVQAEPFRSITKRSKLFRLPVIRGFLSLGETLWLGMKALTISTNKALGEEEDLSKKEIAVTMLFGLALAFSLFLAAPVLGTKGIGALLGSGIENPILFNLVEGTLRIGIFMLYLLGITAISKDIKRFFAYHGAEHKAIKVYEKGEELVPENARKLDPSHVRCGTSFRSEEHTSELQSRQYLVCRLLLEKKKKHTDTKLENQPDTLYLFDEAFVLLSDLRR